MPQILSCRTPAWVGLPGCRKTWRCSIQLGARGESRGGSAGLGVRGRGKEGGLLSPCLGDGLGWGVRAVPRGGGRCSSAPKGGTSQPHSRMHPRTASRP